ELDLLEENFLTTHCLRDAEQDSAGVWTVSFRPVAPRRDELDIRGTLRIDGATYAVREIAFEYLRGGRPWGRGTLHFAEVSTPYGVVRLPARGTVYGDPGGTLGLLLRDFEGTFTVGNYREFEEVGG
ncbi:MAG TPA: hypothetical protein VFX98_03700, partial [Longimicrobiaceae bacterium]|nr:hypothetical protein [Longimicrobiaceae bacterium]